MSNAMPEDGEVFAAECVGIVHEINPNLDVSADGHLSLIIDGKRLDLSNAYKMSLHAKNSRQLVKTYLEHILEAEEEMMLSLGHNFLEVRNRIYPRIQHKSIFESMSPETTVFTDWVNDCVICYVVDFPKMTVAVNVEQVVRWRVHSEDLHETALRNLSNTIEGLEMQHFKLSDGQEALLVSTEDGYDASRILAPEFYSVVSSQFEGDFYAGLPARDMLFAVPANGSSDSLLRNVRLTMMKDYHRLPYPITPNLFYATLDGVAPAVDFDLKSEEDIE